MRRNRSALEARLRPHPGGPRAACFAADHGDQEASLREKALHDRCDLLRSGNEKTECPSSITYSFALGIRAARILALIRGTIGSSLPCMTSVGCPQRAEPGQAGPAPRGKTAGRNSRGRAAGTDVATVFLEQARIAPIRASIELAADFFAGTPDPL